MIASRKPIYILVCVVILIMGHAPWGQHHVYRQIHMLIMCSKLDRGAFEFSKNVVSFFQVYLPEAKARVARAPHEERIYALMKTNQIPLALLSYDLIDKISERKEKFATFLKEEARVLFFFPDMVLISNNQFPEKKSKIIFDSLIKASGKKEFEKIVFQKKNNFPIPFFKSIKE